MFKRQIVIIVGAGSGVEYSMPLGATLAAHIARDARFRFEHYSLMPTSGDTELFNILFRHEVPRLVRLRGRLFIGSDRRMRFSNPRSESWLRLLAVTFANIACEAIAFC